MCPLLREQTDVRNSAKGRNGPPTRHTNRYFFSKRAAHTIRLLVAWLVLKVRLFKLYLFFGGPGAQASGNFLNRDFVHGSLAGVGWDRKLNAHMLGPPSPVGRTKGSLFGPHWHSQNRPRTSG